MARRFDSVEDGVGRLDSSERFGGVADVGVYEAADFFSQFAHAGEDAPPEGALVQLSEPGRDGIEPLCAGRREVQVKAGMGREEIAYRFSHVRAAVVDDQVQRQFGWRRTVDLRKELPERGGAMPPGDAAEHVACCDIEGGMEIRGSVPLVVVGAPRDLPGPQREEHRIGPVEVLDLCLLVDRERQRVVGWVEVEPHDVDDLLGELQVRAELEGLEAMGLDVGSLPLRDPGVSRHQPGAPMRCLDGHPLGGQKQNALVGAPAEHRRPSRARPVHQSSEPIGAVATVPQVHGRPVDVQQSSRFRGAAAPVAQEQDARPQDLTARRSRPSQPPFQGLPVLREQLKVLGRLHASDSTKFP